ncbi:LLM class flavin-dependent oxidoreductase [Mycobacterium sp. 236(2023)]|uniref:LLM class flavin-dependent oxidoreductase n=1 Tax=Mycobacterium sp. 236(2023) TaxID=3038163 RepID=UPI00241514B3|nr:LLM class flavin-dependent oxidoreductase [Mycobacterium sp. 236(2023)]MDG4667050.1 LLM class flavin-dependent oxidoreductase [Mycobacterium sp. 236(2023)]
MTGRTPLHLAVALNPTGWHPASWRDTEARPADLLTPSYWVDLVGAADRGHVDLVTFDDGLTLQPDGPQGRLDAVLTAARVAPHTSRVGLLPTVIATHTEPFHLSKAIATLDYVSSGRAGVHVQVSADEAAARHFGRRATPTSLAELYEEATDYVEVLRRLWDSWEDDAEIRDAATGRFIDRNKLHYIDFEGKWFSVKGPSITPRPPQGQPLVAASDDGQDSRAFIGGSADIAFVPTHGTGQIGSATTFVDLVVFLDDAAGHAASRRRRLDDLHGAEYTGEARIFDGTPVQLAELLQEWSESGVAGVRLLPATLPHDLVQITSGLTPELRRRRLSSTSAATALRELLGLARPANRYAEA